MKNTFIALTANMRENAILLLIRLVLVGVLLALANQVYFVYLDMSGQEKYAAHLDMQFVRKFDDSFNKDAAAPATYVENTIFVRNVTNEVSIGKMAGDRNLEFGVKNVLEEYLQDKGYDLSPDAKLHLDVSVVYLDVLNTKTNISILRKTESEVVIRLKGTLYKEGKKVKETIVEESSSEISMATLVIDQGGKFNQASLSNALKKSCDKLITKLVEKK